LGEIWFPSRVWCCELISMVWEPYYDPAKSEDFCILAAILDSKWPP
jgi:hypothetical protein